MTPITIDPVPGSPTMFRATSRSRPGLTHQIDMAYDDLHEGILKPKPHCGCEENHIKGHWCRHLQAVVEYLCRFKAETDAQYQQTQW